MVGQTLYDVRDQENAIIHASSVAVGGQGLLIIGAAGAGKSSLALSMMALGAGLVSDDRASLRMDADAVIIEAAPNIKGVIEARGIGLLRAEPHGAVPLRYVVDLDQTEPDRLPEPHHILVLRQTVPLLRAKGVPTLAPALMQLMKMGRVNPEWPNS